jgi:DNA-binding winged helix-turn-helix (wHTH) protein
MGAFAFEPFVLDPDRRRLTRDGEPVAISERQLDVLLRLVAQAGQVVAKDDLIAAGWKDVAVADNSLEQAISALRRVLGARPDGTAYIETIPRRGYRFGVTVERRAARETDASLDALLAPHRAFVEGRAALESLEASRVEHALGVFQAAIAAVPEYASAHIGLANAYLMRFEMTRVDPSPDRAALAQAIHHAREACRLDARSAEAWATLGFVLSRSGQPVDALAAANRAVRLEPDNWRHHFRLANVSWGEERLRAAHRTLALLPEFPLAHWLAATVYVARQLLDEADRELTAGLASESARAKFGAVALHWLRGLIYLARGDEERAITELQEELACESAGHLYSRECCANTWYAIGAIRRRQGRRDESTAAFRGALERVAAHPMALVALHDDQLPVGGPETSGGPKRSVALPSDVAQTGSLPVDLDPINIALVQAAALVLRGTTAEAAHLVTNALVESPPGNGAWLLPIEPLIHAGQHPDVWATALAHLRNRAS